MPGTEQGLDSTHSVEPLLIHGAVQSGRRYAIDLVLMGQQPNELHNTVRNQLIELCCFRLTDDWALEFPVEKFGFRAEALQALREHQWICRDKFDGEDRSN